MLLAALTPPALQKDVRARNLLPLAAATAALLGVLSLDGGVWIAPILLPALIVGTPPAPSGIHLARGGIRRCSRRSSRCRRCFSQALPGRHGWADHAPISGNLITPLNKLQVFGIWPVGDFRFRPHNIHLTYVLIALVAVAAVGGLVWAWRCREWGLLLYVAGAAVGCAISVALGSPWIDGKALAIASPAALIAAAAATGWLCVKRRRIEATVAILVIAGGVLWSNALAYREVWLAPRSQLQELETIGTKFSGQGPALMTEYSPFGVRHFLRSMDPEGASELRRRLDLLRDGGEVPKGGYADIDRFQLDGLLVYRTLVLIHSPSSSRPPSNYQLVWSGKYYDVWQRPVAATARILEHVPLGNLPPARCRSALQRGAPTRTRRRRRSWPRRRRHTPGRGRGRPCDRDDPEHVAARRATTRARSTRRPRGHSRPPSACRPTGRYGFWLAGSFRRHVDLFVDDRKQASAQDRLMHPGVDTPLGQAVLTRRAPRHRPALQPCDPQSRQRRATVSARTPRRSSFHGESPGDLRQAGERRGRSAARASTGSRRSAPRVACRCAPGTAAKRSSGPRKPGQAVACTGSGRTMTVSATAMISSTGSSARSACLRIASGLVAS